MLEKSALEDIIAAIRTAYKHNSTIIEIIKAKQDGARRLPHSLVTDIRLKIELKDYVV